MLDDEILDSEEEREKVEEDREYFENKVVFTEEVPQVQTVLVLVGANTQALAKIVYFGRIREIGKVETLYH